MDFIRVANDHWNFEERSSHKRFFPFGANFIFPMEFPEKDGKIEESLHVLVEDVFKPDIIRRNFKAAAACNMNVMKVFMAAPLVITENPDTHRYQLRDMTPSFWDRLKFLFGLAEEFGIYISLTLSEWCVNGAAWFHQYGNFFGDPSLPYDSLSFYADFLRELAEFCRPYPQLFAYNLATELYLPAANWGGARGGSEFFMFSDEYGTKPFRAWLRYKYGTIQALNEAWCEEDSRHLPDCVCRLGPYASFEEIEQPHIQWLPAFDRYTVPRRVLADYNDFKECVTYYFLHNQVTAIRAADPDHMVTIGLHPDQPGISTKGFGWKHCGIGSGDLTDFDFITLHVYTNFDYLIERPELPADIYKPFMASEETLTRRLHECLLYARFNYFGKPILLEEFGHPVSDPEECAAMNIRTVEELAGSVSGYQLWFLGCGQKAHTPGPVDFDGEINDFGRRWAELNAPGGFIDSIPAERTPPMTIVTIDREFGNAPDAETIPEKIIRCWDAYAHPVDFVYPPNDVLRRMQREGFTDFRSFR